MDEQPKTVWWFERNEAGDACFPGTGVRLQEVFACLALNESIDAIAERYPQLESQEIAIALIHAGKLLEDEHCRPRDSVESSGSTCNHYIGLVLDDEYRGLLEQSRVENVMQYFRQAAIDIGGPYKEYATMPDAEIIRDQVSFFKFCPKCGQGLDIPKEWQRKYVIDYPPKRP